MDRKSGGFFSEKIILKKTLQEYDMWEQLINEVKFSIASRHPNIIRTHGFWIDN